MEKPKYIHFHNSTHLPLNVRSWVNGSNTLQCVKIEAGIKCILHSSVGEWHLDSMFYDDIDQQRWKGLERHTIVGKFWSKSSIFGEYSSMEYDEPFHCIYDEVELTEKNKIKGRITFSMK
jgi:hypothetical protein